jgi:hypothetical protein
VQQVAKSWHLPSIQYVVNLLLQLCASEDIWHGQIQIYVKHLDNSTATH